ncbi:N-acetylneuraminate lyase [Copidosoma floridanum]|uniref:N-acetylneuraminate lyase n=1 Tax=Copidosoma floridanum TaxID=29053 RepID=UPI0006C9760C|nr:N-acetylneuraminate lyase [Copidosoma floridanum]
MQSRLRYAYRGLVVPVFTPFKNDSKRTVNASLIPRYSDYLRSKSITGVLVNGTTGEGMTMTVGERKKVAEAWSAAAKINDQHLVVQIGGTNLADVKDLASHAESLGVSAILSLPELYYKPSSVDQLFDYLTEISDAAPKTPLLYYHFPNMSKVSIHMGRFLESIGDRIPTLVGIKFTSTNLEEASHAVQADNRRFTIFLGSNEIIPAASVVGIESFMPSTANLFPELVRAIIEHSRDGDYKNAKAKQETLLQVFKGLARLGNPIVCMKAAMAQLSPIEVGPSREPLGAINELGQNQINSLLHKFKSANF